VISGFTSLGCVVGFIDWLDRLARSSQYERGFVNYPSATNPRRNLAICRRNLFFFRSELRFLVNSTSCPDRAMERPMFSKVTVAVAVGLALCAATVQLPATPCVLSNAAGPVACKPGCCSNKACCQTSHERTGPPSQPFAKSGLDQQKLATPPATVSVAVLNQTATEPLVFSRVQWTAHSLSPLALTCIRLI
jgi:hypothetical protein